MKYDKRLSSNDDKVVSGMTAVQCADACGKETSFPCRSFDHDRTGNNCYLSSADSDDAAVSEVKGFDFYQISELLIVAN